jgi:hypothetical protein
LYFLEDFMPDGCFFLGVAFLGAALVGLGAYAVISVVREFMEGE